MSIDLLRIRGDTPGCSQVTHLNNAGAALMPAPVIDAVQGYFELECAIGGYEAARERSAQIEAVYDSIATLVGCRSEEIAVVENATRAWDMAFYSIPLAAGDRVLTCVADYASNYMPLLQVCRRTGARLEVIPNDEFGQLSVSALAAMIDETVKLIAITHVPTNGGLVNPAAQVGQIARAHNVLYLLDACQSVGQLPVSVDDIGCDMLTATSRKFLRGPRGMGFLYARSTTTAELEPPFIDLHAAHWTSPDSYRVRADARRFETWETNYSAKVGLGAAVDYALQLGLPVIWQRVQSLAALLRESLSAIAAVELHDLGETKCGIVSFSLQNWDAEALRVELSKVNMNVSVAVAGHTLLDMQQRGLESFIRASLHYYNSEQELNEFCSLVERLSGSARTG
jgi:cysteine desulfurase/selenocysteine lyase